MSPHHCFCEPESSKKKKNTRRRARSSDTWHPPPSSPELPPLFPDDTLGKLAYTIYAAPQYFTGGWASFPGKPRQVALVGVPLLLHPLPFRRPDITEAQSAQIEHLSKCIRLTSGVFVDVHELNPLIEQATTRHWRPTKRSAAPQL